MDLEYSTYNQYILTFYIPYAVSGFIDENGNTEEKRTRLPMKVQLDSKFVSIEAGLEFLTDRLLEKERDPMSKEPEWPEPDTDKETSQALDTMALDALMPDDVERKILKAILTMGARAARADALSRDQSLPKDQQTFHAGRREAYLQDIALIAGVKVKDVRPNVISSKETRRRK